MAKLKVYRTPAGFHDAYVAASSQKAALKAWGSDADLFARGIAEVVTDPELTEAPLAKPGAVIKRARTDADAAPEPAPKERGTASDAPVKPAAKRPAKAQPPKRKPKPRPSRARLDAAEQALSDAAARHAEDLAAIKREEAALAKRRHALEAKQEKEQASLESARDKARSTYDRALAKWRE